MKKNPETAIHEADAREKQAFRYHRWILKGVWCFAVLFFICYYFCPIANELRYSLWSGVLCLISSCDQPVMM